MSKEDETLEPSVPLIEPGPPGISEPSHLGGKESEDISGQKPGEGKTRGGKRAIGDGEESDGEEEQEEKKKTGTICLLLICCLAFIILLAIILIPSYFIYDHFFKKGKSTITFKY